jgi:hypothetical protein
MLYEVAGLPASVAHVPWRRRAALGFAVRPELPRRGGGAHASATATASTARRRKTLGVRSLLPFVAGRCHHLLDLRARPRVMCSSDAASGTKMGVMREYLARCGRATLVAGTTTICLPGTRRSSPVGGAHPLSFRIVRLDS